MFELYHLGQWANGTTKNTTIPTGWLVCAMGLAAYFLALVAPVLDPLVWSVALWFAVQLLGLSLLLALLHLCRPHGPDDPPRSLGDSFNLVVNPLLFAYLGLLLAGHQGHSWSTGEGALGTLIIAILGAALALGGLAAAIHNVRRRL